MKKIIQLSDHFDYGTLFRFTSPSMVMMVITSIYSVVDGLFVSNFVGDKALAAVNIIFPLTMIVGAFGSMLSAGGKAEVARVMGTGEPDLARQYFTTVMLAVVGVGAVLAAVGIIFLEPLSRLLGANDVLMADCLTYGRIMLAGIPIFLLQASFQSFLVVAERPQMGLYLSIGAGVTNMVLDYVFISRLGWGVAGAAAATVCGYVVGGVLPLLYFLFPNKSPLRLVKTKFYGRMLLKCCGIGTAELMNNMSSSMVTAFYNHSLMNLVGEAGVAALSVMSYVDFIFAATCIGFSMGIAPVFSYQLGSGNEGEMKSLFSKCIRINVILALVMAGSAQLLNRPLAQIFVGYDAELMAMTQAGFHIFALSFLFNGFNIFGSAFFAALGNGKVASVLSFLRTFLFKCGAILLLPLAIGLDGIWWAVVVAEGLSAVLTTYFLITRRKKYHYA